MATIKQIAEARLENAGAAIEAARLTGLYLPAALALWEQENMGRNTYGNDSDGTFSTPGKPDIVVTEENYAEFYDLVVNKGKKSNGVGPLQITYRGFHPQAKAQGLNLWDPVDNGRFGFKLLLGYKKTYGTWELARAAYKNGAAAANRGEITASERAYARRVKEWTERLKTATDEEEPPVAWHLAPSLVQLRKEVDAAFPKRSKASDGTLGDAAHAARESQHNPAKASDAPVPLGAVTAIDFTSTDPKVRDAVLKATIGAGRAWYVINRGQIWSQTTAWKPKAYTGSNPHTNHIHISIDQTKAAHDNTASWGISKPPVSPPEKPPVSGNKKLPVLSRGDRHEVLVPFLKRTLGKLPNDDAVFGKLTEARVKVYQKGQGLVADGVVGPKTWAKIASGGTKLPTGWTL